MATNPYFKHYDTNTEQDLIEDLVIEAIQIHGMNYYYLPRTKTKVDPLLTEDRVFAYNAAVLIEIYPENINGFTGDSDLISKFGLEIRDEATFVVSVRRFNEEIGLPFDRYRPLEGDIIYMSEPFQQLFEITFVEHEEVFYQLGKLYVYQLKCRLFENSNQVFDTGIAEIDNLGNVYDSNTERIAIKDDAGQIISTNDLQSIIVSDSDAIYEDNRAIKADDGQSLVADDGETLVVSDIEPSDGSINAYLESFAKSLINYNERDPFAGDTY